MPVQTAANHMNMSISTSTHIFLSMKHWERLHTRCSKGQSWKHAPPTDFLLYLQTVSHSLWVCSETALCSPRRLGGWPNLASLTTLNPQKVKGRTTGCCKSCSQKDTRAVIFIQPGSLFVWIPQLPFAWKLNCKCVKVTGVEVKRQEALNDVPY